MAAGLLSGANVSFNRFAWVLLGTFCFPSAFGGFGDRLNSSRLGAFKGKMGLQSEANKQQDSSGVQG